MIWQNVLVIALVVFFLVLKSEWLIETRFLNKQVFRCLQLQAALTALSSRTSEYKLIWKNILYLSFRKYVTKWWVSEHNRLPGIEKADELAKRANNIYLGNATLTLIEIQDNNPKSIIRFMDGLISYKTK